MITFKNITEYRALPWNDYIKLPGFSYSMLSREINGTAPLIEVTDGMRLGTLVDGILCGTPVDMNDPQYAIARRIAARIKQKFAHILPHLTAQISYTATMHFDGFALEVHGRPDFKLRDIAIIDLKVTKSKNIETLIDYMKYKNQQFGYKGMSGVRESYLWVYSLPLDDVFQVALQHGDSNDFWEEKILKFGTYVGFK